LLFDLHSTGEADKFIELARRLGISDSLPLWIQKLTKIIISDSPEGEKLKALRLIKEAIHPYFDYERPTAFTADEQAETFVKGADTLKEEDYSLDTYLK